MKEPIELLKENPMGFLATVANGEPRLRPWGFMFEEGGKFYFCTNNTKEVYREIKANPHIEFSSTSPNFEWVRLRGEIQFTDNLKIKEKVIESSPMVKNIYTTADNPIFEVFHIEHGTAVVADFSGEPPKEFIF